MAPSAQKTAPSVPSAKPVTQKASDEFTAMKHELGGQSWEIAPSNWDTIQIAYARQGTEQQARSFVKSIELPQQEIL